MGAGGCVVHLLLCQADHEKAGHCGRRRFARMGRSGADRRLSRNEVVDPQFRSKKVLDQRQIAINA